MKKKIYTRPVSVMLSDEVFDQIKTIADHGNIGFSDYIREAIQGKLLTFNKNKSNRNHFRR